MIHTKMLSHVYVVLGWPVREIGKRPRNGCPT